MLTRWCTLGHDPFNNCWFGYITHTSITLFWRMIRFILYIRAFDERYEEHWTILCYYSFILEHNHFREHHFMLGHNHLVWCLTFRYNCLIEDFDGAWSWQRFEFSLLSILGLILDTHISFFSYPNILL